MANVYIRGRNDLENNEKSRYERIESAFKSKYNKPPTFFARAPGRVNIIGEHVDYCGYAVLPMAIEQDIVIACAVNESSTICLANTDQQYTPFSCKTSEIVIDKSKPLWYHYFLCGYKGIIEHFSLPEGVGMDCMLDGTIPRSAGLSSSSALVCCAALTSMYANTKNLTKLELAKICQYCEHYIGTEGGGMDQSISFLAEPGTAKLIEFNPIRSTDIQLPEGAVFVVSNSCTEMNKAATSHFNTRVAECKLATQVLSKLKGLSWREIKTLGQLQTTLNLSLPDMVQLAQESLLAEPYTKDQICNILEVTQDELNQISLSERTYDVTSFKLLDRATHVYSEANRVWQFKAVCEKQSANALQELGDLMNASFSSCRDLYECSCEELNTVCAIALEAGALGSRLTGAGWGGCAVSLVPEDRVNNFLKQVHDKFYAVDAGRIGKVKESLFATQPGGGAAIYTV